MQYSIINYSHHTVQYIPISYLFCNGKFVHFDSMNMGVFSFICLL